ncbi:hypothetical protein [Bacillus subtilis]|uniref:Uncharacterized protein n=1 Tax=Bacillus subtilis subsp. subtilis TaxID=135461 RepID=A0ABD3ZQF2_BACIU|nr:hypothetical protein [Bacillus subtilis]WNA14258.1 hypothetical protein phi182_90 [Bacillus phage phi18-2]KIL30394.1 hypothetical protein B4067_1328 [Bacillus subtilis subsp. subtilis]MEC0399934.1 hypothetical protein [Bacillus subtilis]MEC0429291.1 hypothetical protein [Bacillus subtilis]UWJ02616.1 hypothetical protein N0B18_06955 [Bacillus subtilis]
MMLKIRKLWADTPPLTPKQEAQILDLYERPAAHFDNCGNAYQIGFNTALTYLGYLIETEAMNDD